jgi:hypothetical protein
LLRVFWSGWLLSKPDCSTLGRSCGMRGIIFGTPGRVIGCALAALILSYVLADLAARLLYLVLSGKHSSGVGVYRQHTIWYDTLEENRPKGYGVVATVEMLDGCQFLGSLVGFTPTDVDNRELALEGEIAIRRPGRNAERFTGGDFVLIREDQIKYVAGRFNAPEHIGSARRGHDHRAMCIPRSTLRKRSLPSRC